MSFARRFEENNLHPVYPHRSYGYLWLLVGAVVLGFWLIWWPLGFAASVVLVFVAPVLHRKRVRRGHASHTSYRGLSAVCLIAGGVRTGGGTPVRT